MHGHERSRRGGTRALHDNRHQNPDSGDDPLPAETASSDGVEIPRNPFHSGLQVFDADKQQSASGQDRPGRTRFALGNNPEKGTDAEHRQSKSNIRSRNPNIATSHGVEVVPKVAPMITPTDCAKVTNPALTKPMTVSVVAVED